MTMARIIASFLLLLSLPGFAGQIRGECDIRFQGTSTLHDFSGKVRCRPFAAGLVEDSGGKTTVPLAEIDVLVDEMDTGNKDRDRQMRDMFGSDRFPRIQAALRNIDVGGIRRAMGKEGKGRAVLDLALRIRDVERMVPATATNFREEGDQVRFDVAFPVSLNDFGLKAPSFLLFIRVGDEVVVTGNVRLKVSSNE